MNASGILLTFIFTLYSCVPQNNSETNFAPIANDDKIIIEIDSSGIGEVNLSQLLANDSDPEEDGLIITKVQNFTHASLISYTKSEGKIRFLFRSRPASINLVSFIDYELSDGQGNLDQAKVQINFISQLAQVPVPPVTPSQPSEPPIQIPTPSPIESEEEKFQKAQNILQARCISCHQGFHNSTGVFNLDHDSNDGYILAGLIVPGDANASKLIQRTQFSGGNRANMPTAIYDGVAFSENELNILKNWINSIEVEIGSGLSAACQAQEKPVQEGLVQLTKDQYINTLEDLFNNENKVFEGLDISLNLIQEVVSTKEVSKRFSRFTGNISSQDLKIKWEIAKGISNNVTSNDETYKKFMNEYCSSLNQSCLNTFIQKFGLKTHRRPLTSAEVTSYINAVAQTAPLQEKVKLIIARMLIQPDFLYKLHINGESINSDRYYKLTPYELLSNLSYHFMNTMPDDEMFEMVKQGKLSTEDGYKEVVDSLFKGNRLTKVKQVFNVFMSEWLQLDQFQQFDIKSPYFQESMKGLNIKGNGEVFISNAREELLDFSNYIFFDKKGSIKDLFNNNTSVIRDATLASIYNVEASSNRIALPNRSGLLTRAAFAFTANHQIGYSNIFVRGAVIKKEILCDELGNPPDDFENTVPQDLKENSSAREVAHFKTNSSACISCHSVMNPLGFAMEKIDGFGRYRDNERVIDEVTGEFYTTIPIDASVNPLLNETDNIKVDGPVELSAAIADNEKSGSCISKRYYSYYKGRSIANLADKCSVDKMTKIINDGGSLIDAFKAIAYDENFKTIRLR